MENEKSLAIKDESLPFRIMDALDDQLIISELEGRLPSILTYHYEDKGKELWGLSKAGVDEATGELSKQGEVIRELELVFIDGQDEAFFNVKAGRYAISKDGHEVLLDTKYGTKRQPKKWQTGTPNPFWYEQGCIKACRNASMRLIPKTIVQAVIEYAKTKGKVKDIKKEDITSHDVIDTTDMESLKQESNKKCAEGIERISSIDNMFELKNHWKKHYQEYKNLLPEDFTLLEECKNKMKEKLEKNGE